MDLDSTDHELEDAHELDSFIPPQRGAKIPTREEARIARAQFLALCWSLFMIGWNDGSTGPLLPRIQKFYGVGFGTVSWIFTSGSTGVVLGALMNMPLIDRIGLGKLLVVGSLLHMVAYCIQFLEPPFPFFVLSFGIGAFGMALQASSASGFIGTLKNSESKMGFIHAAYGAGALAAPLSATHFAQLTHWSFHYLVSSSLAVSNIVILAGVFRFATQDECLKQAGEIVPNKTGEIHNNKFGQLMKNKTAHFLALFTVVYFGFEVTIEGWIVTFMMIVRGGGPSSGYVLTGFFGGLTLGRVILVEVTKKIGSIYAIYIFTLFAIFFQLIAWLLPSFAGGAISVSIIGFLIGPMYPIVVNHAARVLPRHLVNGTIGWMTACGAAGSALLPFVTGTMASKLGIGSLQPLLLAMIILLGGVWSLVPKNFQA